MTYLQRNLKSHLGCLVLVALPPLGITRPDLLGAGCGHLESLPL